MLERRRGERDLEPDWLVSLRELEVSEAGASQAAGPLFPSGTDSVEGYGVPIILKPPLTWEGGGAALPITALSVEPKHFLCHL